MDVKDAMAARRAVNFFDPDRDVPQADPEAMLETAMRAPSGFNLQPWKVAVLRDPARKAKLRALAWDQPKVTEAPVVLLFLAVGHLKPGVTVAPPKWRFAPDDILYNLPE